MITITHKNGCTEDWRPNLKRTVEEVRKAYDDGHISHQEYVWFKLDKASQKKENDLERYLWVKSKTTIYKGE